jgi:hypothetical protein
LAAKELNEHSFRRDAFPPTVAGAIFGAVLLPAGLPRLPEKPQLKGGLDNDVPSARAQELAAIRAERSARPKAKPGCAPKSPLGSDRRKLNTDLTEPPRACARSARLRRPEWVARWSSRKVLRQSPTNAAAHCRNPAALSAAGVAAAAVGQPEARKSPARCHRACVVRNQAPKRWADLGLCRSCADIFERARQARSRKAPTSSTHDASSQSARSSRRNPEGAGAERTQAGLARQVDSLADLVRG